MTTITIPRKLTDRELVAVPRYLYEEFLSWQEAVKSKKTFKPTLTEKRSIARGRQEILRGKYVTLEEVNYELGNKNRQRRGKKS